MILFRLLLALFPRAFRDAFGAEMREVFIAQRRAARAGGIPAVLRLYGRTSAGMISAAWRERRERKIQVRRSGGVLRASDLRYALRRLAAAPGFTAAYTATKGAVRLFAKSTAIQHAKEGIRCNSVHPGPIATDMIKDVLEDR